MNAVLLVASVDLQWIVWPSLAAVLGLGVLAIAAPNSFASIAASGGRWIDTEKVLQFLDRPIDVDQHVLRYSRLFGLLVVSAALWLGYLFWTFR